jgi:hypothetical protein
MLNSKSDRTRRAYVWSGGDIRWHEHLREPERTGLGAMSCRRWTDASDHKNPSLDPYTKWSDVRWHSIRWTKRHVRSLGCGTGVCASRVSTDASGPDSIASDRYLTAWGRLPTVGIAWLRLNVKDTWSHRRNRTLVGLHPVILTDASGQFVGALPLTLMALFCRGAYISGLAGSCSLSLPSLLRIHPNEHSNLYLTYPTWWELIESKCIAWVIAYRGTWWLCFAMGFVCFSWWLLPPRRLGAARIIERRKVLVFSSDRGDCEGFLIFP